MSRETDRPAAPDTSPRVAVEGVSKRYDGAQGPVRALSDVGFEVGDGELVCVVGPSGCGKTTLFRIIAGLEEPTEGRVSLDQIFDYSVYEGL